MKIITISKVGYNAPSQANWCYSIFKIDLIDTERSYNSSYVARSAFGGESRFNGELEKENIKVIETQAIYTKTGTPKITGISDIKDIEDKEFIKEVIEWYNKK